MNPQSASGAAAGLPPSSPRSSALLKFGAPLAAVALGVFAWSWYDTEIRPLSGYGDADMSHILNADPRALSGGDMTTFHTGYAPFEQAPDNLPWQLEAAFEEGDGLFEKPFTPGDGRVASELKLATGMRRVGIGPLFNAAACAECHFRDGRVETPYVSGGEMTGIFIRMSVPDGKGGWKAPDGYHAQLHDRAVGGTPAEGIGHIHWEEVPGTFPDGEPFSLRKPHYVVDNLAYGPLPDDVILEARTAPPVHGTGLIEAIRQEDILALAEKQTSDPDGVSGRPNWLRDPETGARVMGRFSPKANEPSLRAQAAGAAFNDMGVTSPVHPEQNCLPHQTACTNAPHGGTPEEPEMSEAFLQSLTTYLQLLAVPARRGLDDPVALRGETLFREARCNACHVETFTTGDTHPLRRLRKQVIHPYTDLLLHDMGPGLAGRPDNEATQQEWRTPPLWGIGLTERSNHHTVFLHDQRARGFQEAILWHGGEAEIAKQRFMHLGREDRAALIRFLENL